MRVIHKQAGLNGTLKQHLTQDVAGVAAVRQVGERTPDPELLRRPLMLCCAAAF